MEVARARHLRVVGREEKQTPAPRLAHRGFLKRRSARKTARYASVEARADAHRRVSGSSRTFVVVPRKLRVLERSRSLGARSDARRRKDVHLLLRLAGDDRDEIITVYDEPSRACGSFGVVWVCYSKEIQRKISRVGRSVARPIVPPLISDGFFLPTDRLHPIGRFHDFFASSRPRIFFRLFARVRAPSVPSPPPVDDGSPRARREVR